MAGGSAVATSRTSGKRSRTPCVTVSTVGVTLGFGQDQIRLEGLLAPTDVV